ncbi:MAG: cytochrome c [Chloroflexi bacterium]|nr:cytochrome c [Chloroflexota bacterium]
MARRRKRYKNRPSKPPSRQWAYIVIAAGALLLLTVVGLAFLSGDKTNQTLVEADDELIALGKQVYEQNCAACHGPQGEGHAAVEEAPALNETEHAWHHPDGQIQELITNGGQIMPAFGDQLSREEIIAVVRYIQTWWEPEQLRAQQQQSRQYPFQ